MAYLGSELAHDLEERAGFEVRTTARQPSAPATISYRLGDKLPADALKGTDALIHCAYDFTASGWKEIHRRNVEGSERLLDQAAAANIPTIVTISSMAAFPGLPLALWTRQAAHRGSDAGTRRRCSPAGPHLRRQRWRHVWTATGSRTAGRTHSHPGRQSLHTAPRSRRGFKPVDRRNLDPRNHPTGHALAGCAPATVAPAKTSPGHGWR